MTHIIYSPDTWTEVFTADPRCAPLLAWLRANGIAPDDVPLNSVIRIEPADSGEHIVHTAYALDSSGNFRAGANGEPIAEERTVPLTVEPPAELT